MTSTFSILFRDTLSRAGLLGVVACLCAVMASPALAQTTGSLSGTVRDTSGAVVPGAKITVTNQDSKARRTTVSNQAGDFTITALPAASYFAEFKAQGFEGLKIGGIEIHPGDHQQIAKVELRVGRVEEEVTVTANTAGVNLESPERSALITADDIKRLSTVGRDATELVKFLPGFAVSTGGGLSNSSTGNSQQTVGFTNASSNFSANGATPQTGATTVVRDGASVMDPGDMGASIGTVNMDMVQEIKVETSNFGAESAHGPVVINAISKSGGTEFHGSAYLIARNGVLNANDWLSNYKLSARPDTSYLYPGGNIGGPVKIPGTNFNHSKKMTFFTAFEYYKQKNFDQLLLSFIPTPRMMTGDLTVASIAEALNVDPMVVTTQCPNFYTSSSGNPASTTLGNAAKTVVPGSLGNSGGFCYSPGLAGTTYTQQNKQIVAGQIIGSTCPGAGCIPVDPHALIYSKFWPKINRTPTAANGLASDGFNYVNPLTSNHDGYQYHGKITENFTDATKLEVSYDLQKVNDESTTTNVYYAGSDIIPYPGGGAFANTLSHGYSLNFVHTFGPTLTNEVVTAGTYYHQPSQLGDRASVQDAATGWTGGRFFNNGSLQLPGLVDYEEGVPDFAMGYFPSYDAFLTKYSFNFGDNLTKQYRSHSFKVGVYAEKVGNTQVPYAYSQGQNTFNHYNSGCETDDGMNISQLQNNVANFLQGCTGFSQSSSSAAVGLTFKTLAFYATDDWKVTKKLTLTLAGRFDHLGPWSDPNGVGLAVWNAPQQHVLSNISAGPKSYPGISWHQTNSAIPLSGAANSGFFPSPRLGMAYDFYGDGRTVLRGGFGAYRFHDSYNDAAGPLGTTTGVQNYNAPNSCTYAQISGSAAGLTQLGKACLSTSSNLARTPLTIYALNPNDTNQPVTYNYNMTINQRLKSYMTLEMSYTGNNSAQTFTAGNLSNVNYIPLGTLFQPDPLTGVVYQAGSQQQNAVIADYRPYPNYGAVYVPNHIGYGNYHSLQVSLDRRKGAFIFGANYTWSKALGIRGDYRTGAVGDPSILRNNYGYLGFNRSQIFNFHFSYQQGNRYHGNAFLRAVLNQWELSNITNLQSGPDVAVLTGGGNFGLSGGVQYTAPGTTGSVPLNISNSTLLGTPDINLQPVVKCDPKSNLHNDNGPTGRGHQYFNGACFALPTLGQNGNFELPDLHGPAYFNSDLTLQRSYQMEGQRSLQFRLSAFNFLNHPLYQFTGGNLVGLNLGFGLPAGTTATSPQAAFSQAQALNTNFGYTPYKSGYRILELTARYNF